MDSLRANPELTMSSLPRVRLTVPAVCTAFYLDQLNSSLLPACLLMSGWVKSTSRISLGSLLSFTTCSAQCSTTYSQYLLVYLVFEAVVHDGPLAGLPAHRLVAHPHTAVPLLRQDQPQVGPQPGVGGTGVCRGSVLW